MSDKKEKIRLTVLARKSDLHWQNILDDSIRFQKDVFVRLEGQGTLTVFRNIESETTEAAHHKVDLKERLWKLPERELKQINIDIPPWKISNVIPPECVQAKPQTFQFQIVPETIDENALFLCRDTEETEQQTAEDTKRFVFWNWEIRHKPFFDRLSTKNEKLEYILSCMDWVDKQKLLLESDEDLIISENEPFPTSHRLRSYQRLLAFIKEFDEQIAYEKWGVAETIVESPEKMQVNKLSSLIVSEVNQLTEYKTRISKPHKKNKKWAEHTLIIWNAVLDCDKEKIEVKSEVEKSDRVPGKRKPHTAFAVYAQKVMKIKRGEAWQKLKDIADASIGQTKVDLPGWGMTYLRRVRLESESEILYSHEPFDFNKSEKLPPGVKKFTHVLFDSSWTDKK